MVLDTHVKRQLPLEGAVYDEEPYRINMCEEHSIPQALFFPHLILAHLPNGTLIEPSAPPLCWMVSGAKNGSIHYLYHLECRLTIEATLHLLATIHAHISSVFTPTSASSRNFAISESLRRY